MEVTAKERGYYGGCIKEVGETFTIQSKKHLGSWMVEGSELPEYGTETFTGYVAARSAAGKFVVKDAAGQMVGAFIGTKEEAETEAQRLNDGGEIA
ncbi:hypothetical protein NHF39_28025 [Pseudomonas proteolytica]|nr:hypothetical protein [Pseudomonas proteolytica]USW94961.1 hypothetical protein NHF39_28025 [Pseudomonas proteolytica]USX01006.1 hypothetical protein NHF41_03650 [Pseudomonas proteolytica]